ncbi:MAG: VRR-NUC domain-containing protein [Fimbriimonadaceae bacterium]|nr:VRR-NUC domain-containing protein [Fimbriimonadaceae bacterium]QYK56643.1 MAG: VRR-NUC domain-containing protein [Fimbriimonadaceae bacterium]
MKKPVPRERQVQESIVEALQLAGFDVKHTSAWRQKGASGVSKGIPDLLVWHPRCEMMCFGIEVKRPGGCLSPEQREAVEKGRYRVATGPVEALEAALAFSSKTRLREAESKCRKLITALRGGTDG